VVRVDELRGASLRKVSDVAGTDGYEQYTSAPRQIMMRLLLGLDSPASIANTPAVASSINLRAIVRALATSFAYCCEPSFGLLQIARGGCRLLSRLLRSNARPITPHVLITQAAASIRPRLAVEPPPTLPTCHQSMFGACHAASARMSQVHLLVPHFIHFVRPRRCPPNSGTSSQNSPQGNPSTT
jgi:hypothetical protein